MRVAFLAVILSGCGGLSSLKNGELRCEAFDPRIEITSRITCVLGDVQSLTVTATKGTASFQNGEVQLSDFDNDVTLTDGVTTANFRIPAAPDIALTSSTMASVIEVRRADGEDFDVPTIVTTEWEYAGGDVAADVIPVQPAFDTTPGTHRFSVQHRLRSPLPESTFFKLHEMELWTLSSIELTAP